MGPVSLYLRKSCAEESMMLAQNVSDTGPGLELDSADHEEYLVPLNI